jgi:hypothetical protein
MATFKDARLKIKRANKHIQDLNSLINEFLRQPDSNHGH